jgi:TBC1 domain family protein 5
LKSPEDQTTAKAPIEAIKRHRKEYVKLMLETLRAPDGSYEDGLSIPGVGQLPRPSDKDAANLQKNNPLGLDEDVRI